MANAVTAGRYDPAIDWLAASFAAGCTAYAASLLGPLAGYSLVGAALTGGTAMLLGGLLFMASMRPARAPFALPVLSEVEARTEGEHAGPDILVLDSVWQDVADELGELLLDRPLALPAAADELVLDDPLLPPPSDSRVVQLFAPQQLKERIDRHLANARRGEMAPSQDPVSGDGDPLSLALAELKRSLRRA